MFSAKKIENAQYRKISRIISELKHLPKDEERYRISEIQREGCERALIERRIETKKVQECTLMVNMEKCEIISFEACKQCQVSVFDKPVLY